MKIFDTTGALIMDVGSHGNELHEPNFEEEGVAAAEVATHAANADAHHDQDHSARHELGGADELSLDMSQVSGERLQGDWPLQSLLEHFILNTLPEDNFVILPFMYNDIAFNLDRGGSASINPAPSSGTAARLFDLSTSIVRWTTNPAQIVIEITLHKTFRYGTQIGFSFGRTTFGARNVKVECHRPTVGWIEEEHYTNFNQGVWNKRIHYSANGVDQMRLTLSDWHNVNDIRVTQIWVVSYISELALEGYVGRGGCESMYGDYLPAADDTYDLGSDTHRWQLVRATTVTQGDIGFYERHCHHCQRPFKIGDRLSIEVIRIVEDRMIEVPVYDWEDNLVETRKELAHGYIAAVPVCEDCLLQNARDEVAQLKKRVEDLEKASLEQAK